jgi:hypothetical protein
MRKAEIEELQFMASPGNPIADNRQGTWWFYTYNSCYLGGRGRKIRVQNWLWAKTLSKK